MTEQKSWHESNADRQKKDVEERVLEAMSLIRSEIEAAYDAKTGLYRYPRNGGKLNKAEFLRRASLDKNTLKANYHKTSRTRVENFLRWAASKCVSTAPADLPSEQGIIPRAVKSPTALELARQERDDAAEKFAVIEFSLSEALQEKDDLDRRLQARDARIQQLENEIVRLKAIVVGLEPDNPENVVDHPTRRR